jgi:alcohol dehydrogenase class IV
LVTKSPNLLLFITLIRLLMMTPFAAFELSRLPHILFGPGRITELPAQILAYGHQILFVMGRRSFRNSPHWPVLQEQLRAAGASWAVVTVDGEPSPQLVDAAVATHRQNMPQVVVGIGGGSVLDAAKAIAGLLLPGNSVRDHLEGVGRGLAYQGAALPFIAVPTTAGTGSEATKNAVLSEHGTDGFKKSFRDERLMAAVALIDSELIATCPPALLAADAMDAFTQLLESYVSTRANPLTDALALSGLEAFRDGFWPAWEEDSPAGRSRLAYASLLSGITLAHTGLGSVHGMAAPLGAFFPIPHGVVCGTLVAEATDINLRALRQRAPHSPALRKYAQVGALLSRTPLEDENRAHCDLLDCLRQWTQRLNLPRLREFGINDADIDKIVAHSGGNSMKTNPLVLREDELKEVLLRRY